MTKARPSDVAHAAACRVATRGDISGVPVVVARVRWFLNPVDAAAGIEGKRSDWMSGVS